MDVVGGVVVAGIGGAGIAESADVGLEAAVGAGAVTAEFDMIPLRAARLPALAT